MPTQPTPNLKSVPNTKLNTVKQAALRSLCSKQSGYTKYSLYYINTASVTDIRTDANSKSDTKLGSDNTETWININWSLSNLVHFQKLRTSLCHLLATLLTNLLHSVLPWTLSNFKNSEELGDSQNLLLLYCYHKQDTKTCTI
jgi:hypothetical protein